MCVRNLEATTPSSRGLAVWRPHFGLTIQRLKSLSQPNLSKAEKRSPEEARQRTTSGLQTLESDGETLQDEKWSSFRLSSCLIGMCVPVCLL